MMQDFDRGTIPVVRLALQRRGYDVRAIRPPTVPEGTARLRLALTLHAAERVVAGLIEALAQESRVLAT